MVKEFNNMFLFKLDKKINTEIEKIFENRLAKLVFSSLGIFAMALLWFSNFWPALSMGLWYWLILLITVVPSLFSVLLVMGIGRKLSPQNFTPFSPLFKAALYSSLLVETAVNSTMVVLRFWWLLIIFWLCLSFYLISKSSWFKIFFSSLIGLLIGGIVCGFAILLIKQI